jgi:hypothetical protein
MADFTNIQSFQRMLLALEGLNRAASNETDRYLATLRALIGQSDEVLLTVGPKGVVALVKDPGLQKQMDDVIKRAFNWRTTDGVIAELQRLQAELNGLPARLSGNIGTVTGDPCSDTNIGQLSWADWTKCRGTQYKAAQSMVAAELTEAAPWTLNGEQTTQFAKKIGIVQYWKNTVAALTEQSFTLQAEVPCGVSQSEQKVKLILLDRASMFDGQPIQPQLRDGLLTVKCSSFQQN